MAQGAPESCPVFSERIHCAVQSRGARGLMSVSRLCSGFAPFTALRDPGRGLNARSGNTAESCRVAGAGAELDGHAAAGGNGPDGEMDGGTVANGRARLCQSPALSPTEGERRTSCQYQELTRF